MSYTAYTSFLLTYECGIKNYLIIIYMWGPAECWDWIITRSNV